MAFQPTFLCSPDVHYSFFKWESFYDKKSWFFIGEEFVCVGSDVTSATGDPIETAILNHRLLQNVECFLSFDNKKIACKVQKDNDVKSEVKCLYLTGNTGHKSDMGIIILKGDDVNVLHDHRKGTWNNVVTIPNHVCENDFLTILLNPKNADYCCVLFLGFDSNETACYFSNPYVELLECSSTVHSVKKTRKVA